MSRNMIVDIAVENTSFDSLSFAGLLCTEDQLYKAQTVPVCAPLPPTNSVDFEFDSATPESTPATLTNSLADVLFSDGQLVPREIPLNKVRSNSKDLRPHQSNKRRPNESVKKSNTAVKNKANKQQGTTARQWFGQRLIQSFATPCRDCRVAQPLAAVQRSPSMKEQTIRQ